MTAQYPNRNGEKPEEIRSNIQQTRQDMSRKIDVIQERLDPQKLKAQAQDAIYEAANDSADAIVTYVRENSGDLGKTLVGAVKRNPVPAALVALGMGWMVLDSLSNSDDQTRGQDSVRYPLQRYEDAPHPYTAQTDNSWNRNEVYASYPEYREGENSKGWVEGVKDRAATVAHSVQDSASDMQSGITQKVKETADQISETASQAWNSARNMAEQAQQSVRDRAQDTAEYAQSGTQHMRNQTSEASQRGQQKMEEWREQMSDQTDYLAGEAQRRAQEAGVQIQRNLNDHPLPYGAIAFAVGAAIGLALPSTRKEDEWMGDTRDQLWQGAQNVANEAADRTQRVIDEVKPELQATAEKVVGDVKQAGQEAARDIQNSLDRAGGTAKEAGREAADDLQQTFDKAEEKASAEADKVKNRVDAEADKVAETAKNESQK